MKKIFALLLLSFFSTNLLVAAAPAKKLLLFSYTQKYRHKSIEVAKVAITQMANKKNYELEFSENPADFTTENLQRFDALIFVNPTGSNVFSDEQKAAFKGFINKGGGFVGIHAATDFCFEWEWYGKLVGAFFTNHPKIQEAKLNVVNHKHPSTKHLPKTFRYTDEWYNFKDFNKDVKVLLTIDESSYTGGNMGQFHPISWYHKYDGGKVFYTALGHRNECYTDELFMKHLLGGLEYVLK